MGDEARGLPRNIIHMEALAFYRQRPIRWKRPTEHFVVSHCGLWRITPIYGGLTRPESYQLLFHGQVVGSGQTQRECKLDAENFRRSP
jgi:hypothetical protein